MEAEEQQELAWNASFLERNIQETKEQIDNIEREIFSLEVFNDGLELIDKEKENTIFASLGKGVYVRSNLSEKKLLVNVGSGILVKKTPQETKKVVENQIKKLNEARLQLLSRLELYVINLKEILLKLEKFEKTSS